MAVVFMALLGAMLASFDAVAPQRRAHIRKTLAKCFALLAVRH